MNIMTQDHKLLTNTKILDFKSQNIQELIENESWDSIPLTERIGSIYNFVRNEIAFGYNRADHIKASEVLSDGYGQRNTKGTLLMALLRGVGVPCRIHGFTIHKELQRGVVPALVYPLAPREIIHSWIEVRFDNNWINLEGFILDQPFLKTLQQTFSNENNLCGYGVGTRCLNNPPVEWKGTHTYIQHTGIVKDLGVFDAPDAFYQLHQQEFGFIEDLLYKYVIRHWMNRRVRRIRSGNIPRIPGLALPNHRHYEKG